MNIKRPWIDLLLHHPHTEEGHKLYNERLSTHQSIERHSQDSVKGSLTKISQQNGQTDLSKSIRIHQRMIMIFLYYYGILY